MNKTVKSGYQLDWKTLKHEWPLWIWMAAMLIAGFLLYPHLPDRVPSHWNIRGEVDSYSSRAFGAFFAPLLSLGLYWAMVFFPMLDPKRDNYARFAGPYRFIRWGLVLFMSAIYLVTVLVALGFQINVGMVVKALVAVLFVLIGNFMGQFRHNYFVGIRTPWTLANETVWQQTHRVGGKVWVAAGLLSLALAPVNAAWAAILFFALMMVMALVPVIYSFLVFRRLSR